MGQNFLINDAIKKNIVQAAQVKSADHVLEIGPGLGAITKYLALATDQLLLVELDKRLAAFLQQYYPQVRIVNDDVLRLDLKQVFTELNWDAVKVVANLPYSISSKIIIKLLKTPQVDSINILVQKEMAERLLSKPNTKAYNAFSVLAHLMADVSVQLKLKPQEFYPAPEVDSWFITLTKHKRFDVDFEKIDKLLRISFASRRKKLINNLTVFYEAEQVRALFKQLQWDENFRAEDLSTEQFVQLYNLLQQG